MNREIKFRGKRKDNGEWIYGDLVHWKQLGKCAILPQEGDKWTNPIDFEVNPKTVGQFMGKIKHKDSDIFEEDIIKHGESIRFIEFRSGNTHATRINKEETILLSFCRNPIKIGNIHDNPELL